MPKKSNNNINHKDSFCCASIVLSSLIKIMTDMSVENSMKGLCSPKFFAKIKEQEEYKDVFKNYSADTLRKYWYFIRQTNNISKFIYILKNNMIYLAFNNFPTQTVIRTICCYIKCDTDVNFCEFYRLVNDPKNNRTKRKNFSNPVNKRNAK